MLFALGTTNIPKTDAIKQALDACPYLSWQKIEIQGYKVASWIRDMPLTLDELRLGSKNRVQALREICPDADYFVGMEWGVYPDSVGTEYWLTGIVYIENTQGEGHFGYSCHMPVPAIVAEKLCDGSGLDLEQIMEWLWEKPGIGDRDGSFGVWSANMITRTDQFRLATQCALVPFFSRFYSLQL